MSYAKIREETLEFLYERTEQIPAQKHPPRPVFLCPFCKAVYTSRSERRDHVSSAHRVDRPRLLLGGMEPGSRYTVRSSLSDMDIFVENATMASIAFNGAVNSDISLENLKAVLSTCLDGECKISLTNDAQENTPPVVSSYEISLRIASEDQLRLVDRAFDEIVMAGALSLETIGVFLEDDRSRGTSSEYAGGLADYLLGVLLKERSEQESLTTPFSRYWDAYGSAHHKLIDFDRPLANLVASIIRFAMNNFSALAFETGCWELDLANELLTDPRSTRLEDYRKQPPPRKSICPIDHGTGQILTLAERMFCQERWSPILDEECRRASVASELDATDQQKALAIWAASAWRLGSHESAIEPLRQIAATYPFGKWPKQYLESTIK